MRLELRDEEGLIYQDEFDLTDKPLKIDLMIVKKSEDVVINNKIGKIFKGHNVIEYKSPTDTMNSNTFYKTIAYACLYMVSPKHAETINSDDVTITLLRNKKPVKLLQFLETKGYFVNNIYSGIYYITGLLFDMQVIVSSELSEKEHKWISSLNTDISYDLYISLYNEKNNKLNNEEKEMADNVMQVVTTANADIIEKWKESKNMCQALKDIMKPELEEALEEAMRRGKIEGEMEGQIKAYFKCGKKPEEIAELTNSSLEYVKTVIGIYMEKL